MALNQTAARTVAIGLSTCTCDTASVPTCLARNDRAFSAGIATSLAVSADQAVIAREPRWTR